MDILDTAKGCGARIMRVYKNGELFYGWIFNKKTRPIGGPVESFRLGSGRTGGPYWNGWVDEFRMGLFY